MVRAVLDLKAWFRPSLALPRIEAGSKELRLLFLCTIALSSLSGLLVSPKDESSSSLFSQLIATPLLFFATWFGIWIGGKARVWVLALITGRKEPEFKPLAYAGFLWSWSASTVYLLPLTLPLAWYATRLPLAMQLQVMWMLSVPGLAVITYLWSRFLAERCSLPFRKALVITLVIEALSLGIISGVSLAFSQWGEWAKAHGVS